MSNLPVPVYVFQGLFALVPCRDWLAIRVIYFLAFPFFLLPSLHVRVGVNKRTTDDFGGLKHSQPPGGQMSACQPASLDSRESGRVSDGSVGGLVDMYVR